MLTERKALHAFVIIGVAALFGLSTATAWAGSEKAEPRGQALGLDKNKHAAGGGVLFGSGSEGGTTTAVVAAGVPTDIESVAIFATNSVELSSNTTVTGDVVVNDASPGPTLDAGGFELSILSNVLVSGNAAADSIDLGVNSTVTGDATFNELSKRNTSTIQGNEITPLDLRVLDAPAFQAAVVSPDAPDVVVGAGQIVSLPTDLPSNGSNNYGDITLAKNSTLVFEGGIFNVRSIVGVGGTDDCGANNPGAPGDGSGLDPCRAVTFDAASDVRVD